MCIIIVFQVIASVDYLVVCPRGRMVKAAVSKTVCLNETESCVFDPRSRHERLKISM